MAIERPVRTGRWLARTPAQLVLIAMSVATVFPVYFMVSTSLKSKVDYAKHPFAPPFAPTLSNFSDLIDDGRVPRWFVNSVIVTSASSIAAIVLATLAAFALSRFDFPGRNALSQSMIALLVVPSAVLVLPLFLSFRPLHLLNTLTGVIIIYTGLVLPFSVFMLTSFFANLPGELFEAARMDGAGTWRLLTSIALPLSGPALITLLVVNALSIWNELLVALVFLQDDQKRTLMAGLTLFKSRYSVNEPLIMGGAVIGILPMLLLFLFGQRFFIRGLVAGSVK
jgi:raffinose/stachyose/melibiose transport system permease protein